MESTFLIKAAQLIAAFGLLIIVHEFGHYIFARMFGIRVEKFYLFFNPWFSLFKWKPKKKAGADDGKSSWRDTEYGIGWLPLGGYCKIAGMIDESMDKEQMAQPVQPWEFRAKPAWQRLLVMIAGVLFNFILAIIIYAGIAFAWGDKYIQFSDAEYGMQFGCESAKTLGFRDGDILVSADGKTLDAADFGVATQELLEAREVTVKRNGALTTIELPKNALLTVSNELRDHKDRGFMTYRFPVVVKYIVAGQPAAAAGLKAGDRIVGIDSVRTETWDVFAACLAKSLDKEIAVTYERGGKEYVTHLHTSESGKIGIQLTPIDEIFKTHTINYNIFQAIPRGIEIGVDKLTSYVSQMKYVFTKEGAESLGGFGAIGDMFPAEWSWYHFWFITAFISVALAFMNILPIPALDGGHALFVIIEMLTGKKPSEKVLEYSTMVGLGLLLVLLLYANGNDIYRFFIK